ncbi:DUF4440 domain-containing protein [Edaphobacter sp. 12200R-103]|uniref:nuclear transport factor 2 family protein n=1 Tax=Edaphobacter sp. 12200R-103 TaxID=2703788 RepID=UPI00138BA363|nr:DUF4440 domain-containing protein [Edaphobacter sp. 12200R-103]QHS50746.1 DUF4440 domain-containing protein [Edaphobacter sp. 12200R-103]
MHAEIDADILSQLISLEPIFHRFEGLSGRLPTHADIDSMMAPEFFEIGVSGRLYSRDFIIRTLEARFSTPEPQPDHFRTSEFHLLRVSADTWLLSYVLRQEITDAPRISRRTTLWKKTVEGWKILFHQGTLVEGAPLPESGES